jgi:large subunit ribosomal protein L21
MYAVIASGGKQYRVAEGDCIKLEKLEAEENATIHFDNVLMIADGDKFQLGAPFIQGGKVSAVVQGHGRGKKITIIKMRRRKNYRRRAGHRQSFTEVKITGIAGANA